MFKICLVQWFLKEFISLLKTLTLHYANNKLQRHLQGEKG